MKIIGLFGGMSWESTVPYYRQVNELIKERLGGFHSAKVVLYSVDFHEVEQLQQSGDWEAAGDLLAGAARAACLGRPQAYNPLCDRYRNALVQRGLSVAMSASSSFPRLQRRINAIRWIPIHYPFSAITIGR